MPRLERLPSNKAEEKALVSAALIDPDFVLTETDISPEAFYDDECRGIWQAIQSLNASGANITVLTVEQEARRLGLGDLKVFNYVSDYESPFSAPHIAKRLLDLQKRREIVEVAADVTRQAYDITQPVEQIAARLTGAIDGAMAEDTFTDGLSLMDNIILTAAHPVDTMGERIFTGLAGLDSTLLGIEDGRFFVGAAVPNTGKSIFTIAVARGVMSGNTPCGILYIRPEQGDIELSNVMMSSGTDSMRPARVKLIQLPQARRDEYAKMLMSKNPTQTQQVFGADFKMSDFTRPVTVEEQAQMRKSRIALKWPIRYMDPRNWSVFVIRQRIRAMRTWLTRQHGPDAFLLVIVDGMHLLAGDGEKSRVQELTTITRELKSSAQNDVTPGAIMANHQLNYTFYQGDMRAASNRRYSLRSMRDSGTVGQDADVVYFVDRQTVFEQDNAALVRPTGGWDPFTLFFKKNRQTSHLFATKFEMNLATLAVRDKEEPWR